MQQTAVLLLALSMVAPSAWARPGNGNGHAKGLCTGNAYGLDQGEGDPLA